MKSAKKYLGGVSIAAGARVFHVNHQLAGKDVMRTLRRRADGALTFMNGSPIRANELLPGVKYSVINDPAFGGEKR